jgi:hypothetical protein
MKTLPHMGEELFVRELQDFKTGKSLGQRVRMTDSTATKANKMLHEYCELMREPLRQWIIAYPDYC